MDNLLGRNDDDDLAVAPLEGDDDAPGVVAMPGMGGLGMGGAGVGLAAFPVGGLADDAGAGSDDDPDADRGDSPDSFAGGGATSAGRDKNADALDR